MKLIVKVQKACIGQILYCIIFVMEKMNKLFGKNFNTSLSVYICSEQTIVKRAVRT